VANHNATAVNGVVAMSTTGIVKVAPPISLKIDLLISLFLFKTEPWGDSITIESLHPLKV
jgi:hypothetical protein